MGEPYYSVRLGRGTGPLHPLPASGRIGVYIMSLSSGTRLGVSEVTAKIDEVGEDTW